MVLPDDFRFQIPLLETDRLIMRRMAPEDAAAVFAFANDPAVAAQTTWDVHESIDDSRAYLDRVMGWYREGFGGPWGLELKETGQLIGTCGLAIVPSHARGELGYTLGRAWWGRGLTTEAVIEAIRYGFEELSLNRIEARCMPSNVASARVMEKAGMTYEGTLREQYFVKGRFHDLKMYSILRSEWSPAV